MNCTKPDQVIKMLIIVAIFAAFALVAVAASMWGVDSRPGFTDPRSVEPSTLV